MSQLDDELQEIRRTTIWKSAIVILVLYTYIGAFVVVVMALQLVWPRLLAALVPPFFASAFVLALVGFGIVFLVIPRMSRLTGVNRSEVGVFYFQAFCREHLVALRFAWLPTLLRRYGPRSKSNSD